uniref:Transmembrane protein n=1 Tax=Medicago truncatula TaxID=3880 RepID=I3S2U3_MEDTR|nr:unknown [Medicago truncatula]
MLKNLSMVGKGFLALHTEQRSENMLKFLIIHSVALASSNAAAAAAEARAFLSIASFPSLESLPDTASRGTLPSVHFFS